MAQGDIMEKKKIIGFIGTGNMGGALARAVYKSAKAGKLLLSNRTREKADKLAQSVGGEVCSNKHNAAISEYIFIGIEPAGLNELAEEICPELSQRSDRYIIVSMLAGKTIADIEKAFGKVPVIRIMPNMPAAASCGYSLYTVNELVTGEEKSYFAQIMEASGVVEEADEDTMSSGTGITGCGPAFAAMFIEALTDGAVAVGLSRDKALRYAAGMLKGSAEMLFETGDYPEKLKDSVCSPGGSTIQGVRVLEERGFRAAVMDALITASEKKFK